MADPYTDSEIEDLRGDQPRFGGVSESRARWLATVDALREAVEVKDRAHALAIEREFAANERAEKAEALLREAQGHVAGTIYDIQRDYSDEGGHRNEALAQALSLLARIDALLDAPTDADRRGEDREAIDAQGGSTPD